MSRRYLGVFITIFMFMGSVMAANYVFESTVISGVGYRNHELVSQTAQGDSGQKIVKKVSGSGNLNDRYELELSVHHNSINYSQEANFEYFPTSYQTGNYDQKWQDKLCVINYDAGAVVTETYTSAESLEKVTTISTMGNDTNNAIEASFRSEVVGVAHIGWMSRDPEANDKGRHPEYGRSVEDLTGVFSIDKYIQLANNESDVVNNVDWLPCI